jgi:23S rRNA pseudouridine2457 synthase
LTLIATSRDPQSAVAGVVLLNKPFGVLCQFSGGGARLTLRDFVATPDVYPAGRLDADSEGLVVLTADGALQARITNPRYKLQKTYWVQVEGEPAAAQLAHLARGVSLPDGMTRPAGVRSVAEPPSLWPRDPPIRTRKNIPTTWLEMAIAEGRNRQIRRMTAAVGLPTLRLIRWSVGRWTLAGLAPGESRIAVL